MSPAVTMTGAITALAAEKRATGYKYDTEERVLARFAAFSGSRTNANSLVAQRQSSSAIRERCTNNAAHAYT